MEGITRYVYRNAHARFFGGVDRYYCPFITPKPKRGFNFREKNDIDPDHNQGIRVIPQILTRKPADFVFCARKMQEMGYDEINLNLGCPSGTVVSKGKGSGFLQYPEELRLFFEKVFAAMPDLKLSVKTRLGMQDPEEIIPLMEIYNDFPLQELIIHARVREDYYKKPVNRSAFRAAARMSRHPVCYNGDIFSLEDYRDFARDFPEIDRIMVGRGLLTDPHLAVQIREDRPVRDLDLWQPFLDEICAGYGTFVSGEKNMLYKMKELWNYMLSALSCGEKYARKLRKSRTLREYRNVVSMMLEEERSRA